MADSSQPREEVRVWCDGCYDMVHFGHANQLRQAKKMGAKLIVGVHNDAEITKHKGPPVFTEEERYRMVRGIKWVDEIVENAPYATTVETLDKYDCAFCVHGDDITMTADGRDTYEEVKRAGRYRECRRTPGVSTTDLVGRMLLLTKDHHDRNDAMDQHIERARTLSTDTEAVSPWTRVSRFMPSTQTITEFAQGREANPTDRVVYVCGSFDLFHVGHLCFLEEAAKLGDYLVVGIWDDAVVNDRMGANHPIMSLHQRVLSVLAYKPVNEVIIGAPYAVTEELIKQYNVSVVAVGLNHSHHENEEIDVFAVPKSRGLLRVIDSGSSMTTDGIIRRIIEHRLLFEERNAKKEHKEAAAYRALQSMAVSQGPLNTHNVVILGQDETKKH